MPIKKITVSFKKDAGTWNAIEDAHAELGAALRNTPEGATNISVYTELQESNDLFTSGVLGVTKDELIETRYFTEAGYAKWAQSRANDVELPGVTVSVLSEEFVDSHPNLVPNLTPEQIAENDRLAAEDVARTLAELEAMHAAADSDASDTTDPEAPAV